MPDSQEKNKNKKSDLDDLINSIDVSNTDNDMRSIHEGFTLDQNKKKGKK